MNYRYITQDIIDAGTINITSPAMYAEAREYNIDAGRNYCRRRRNHILMGLWFAAQPVIIFITLFVIVEMKQIEQTHRETYTTNARIIAGVAGLLAFVGAYAYFVGFRGYRTPWVMLLCSLPLVFVHPVLTVLCAANFFIGMWYSKWERILRGKDGYPDFTQLAITTIDSEANTVGELTFDNIRERAVNTHRHDGSFLK